jgi:transposase
MCVDCHNHTQRHTVYPPLPSLPPPSPSPPHTLFQRPEGCIDPLTVEQRSAIITLNKLHYNRNQIANIIPCSTNAVSRWTNRWDQTHTVEDNEKSGRPRCTAEDTDEKIELFAEEKKFIVPKDIRRELQLSCSARTIRRRLDEVNLFGRISRVLDDYDDRILRLRLSFANGFLHFNNDDWDTVIFSDEVHFCLGHHGQVWVQRPPGTAYDMG